MTLNDVLIIPAAIAASTMNAGATGSEPPKDRLEVRSPSPPVIRTATRALRTGPEEGVLLQAAHALATRGGTASVQVRAITIDLIGGFGFNASPVGRTVDVVRYDGAIFETSWQGWDNAPSTNVRVDAACIFTEDQVSPGDHNLVTLEVEIPADLPPGTVIPVELTNAQFFNYDFSVPTLIPRDGSITVLGSSDLDGDGTVGAEDLGRLLAAWGPAESDAAADLDGDLVVDGFDLGRLLDRWGGQG